MIRELHIEFSLSASSVPAIHCLHLALVRDAPLTRNTIQTSAPLVPYSTFHMSDEIACLLGQCLLVGLPAIWYMYAETPPEDLGNSDTKSENLKITHTLGLNTKKLEAEIPP